MIVRQTLGFHNRSLLIVYLIILRANWKEGVEISLPFGPRGAIFPKWKKFLPKWQDALQRG